MAKKNKEEMKVEECNLAQPRFKENYLLHMQTMVSGEFAEEVGKVIRRRMECPSIHLDHIETKIEPYFRRKYDLSEVYHYFTTSVDSAFHKSAGDSVTKNKSIGVICIGMPIVSQMLEIFYGGDISKKRDQIMKEKQVDSKKNDTEKENATDNNEKTNIDKNENEPSEAPQGNEEETTSKLAEIEYEEKTEEETSAKTNNEAAESITQDQTTNDTNKPENITTQENSTDNSNDADQTTENENNSEDDSASNSKTGRKKIVSAHHQRLGQGYFLLSRGEKHLSTTLAQLITDVLLKIWRTRAKVILESLRLPEGADLNVKEERSLFSKFNVMQTYKGTEKINLGSIKILVPLSALFPLAVSRSKHDVEVSEPKTEEEWSNCMKENICIPKVEISAILSHQEVTIGKIVKLGLGDIIPVKLQESVTVKAAKRAFCKANVRIDGVNMVLKVIDFTDTEDT